VSRCSQGKKRADQESRCPTSPWAPISRASKVELTHGASSAQHKCNSRTAKEEKKPWPNQLAATNSHDPTLMQEPNSHLRRSALWKNSGSPACALPQAPDFFQHTAHGAQSNPASIFPTAAAFLIMAVALTVANLLFFGSRESTPDFPDFAFRPRPSALVRSSVVVRTDGSSQPTQPPRLI
jgi:hypothetical protein